MNMWRPPLHGHVGDEVTVPRMEIVDGGALRIRRGSGALRTMAECEAACAYEDVLPLNGRLLVFDSRLAHEVRPNTHREGRARRALTVWITRPETSGARGEVWDEGEEEAAGGGAAAA